MSSTGGGRRGRYLGFIAHEIKNPLATALWSCDLLKRMEQVDRAGPKAEKMIDASLRALRRMRRLVDDFFTIERLIESGYELRQEEAGLRELVDGALLQLSEKDGIKTAAWSVEIATSAQVSGDLDMLRRGLRALCEHMCRPDPEQRLSLFGSAAERGAVLFIRAEKPPEPLLPPVPEDRPSGDPQGAVLGFALAGAILDVHGGSIEAKDGGLALTFTRRA